MMNPPSTNPYLRTKILTASPEELRLMLYEGAIKFCHQAVTAMQAQDHDAGYNALMRAQRIVLELTTSLNHKQAPELCERLSALYTYIYRRLIDANVKRDAAAVQEAIKLLDFEKQTWQLLMARLAEEGFSRQGTPAGDSVAVAGGHSPAGMSSLSVRVG